MKRILHSRLAATATFLVALLLFSLNLDRPPHPDELHHVLAAQHLVQTGLPLIGEGQYWRGIIHTWLVAISYEIFGEGLASARLPSVLVVALVAPILFLWVRREANSLAAWITVLLFVSSPFTVEIAQFSRFYALQMFFFVSGAACIFYALASEQALQRRLSLGVLGTALLALAVWQQVTSLMGLAGIGAWTFGILGQKAISSPVTNRRVRKGVVTVLVVIIILVTLAVTLTDVLEWAWQRYQSAPLFAAKNAADFWFYHVRFLVLYPTLWPLVGLLALIAAARSPRIAWYAVAIFVVSFLLTSFAAQKATRYFSFAPPFLAVVWGIGLANVLPSMRRYLEETRTRLDETLALPHLPLSVASRSLVVVALAIVVVMNPFWLRTATLIGNVALPFETPATDWRAAREVLAPWTNGVQIMVTTEELGAIYFLGRSDVRFSPSKFGELPPDQRFEFGIDRRTGRPIVSKPESLERLIACFQRGIVVGPIEHWGNPILINKDVQAVLQKHAKPIEVPEKSHLYAWGWAREGAEVTPGYCLDLRRFSGIRVTR